MNLSVRISLLRIGGAVAAVIGVTLTAAWIGWGPVGVRVTDGRHDRGKNAIWLGHGWLGDDGWFARQKRENDRALFRSRSRIEELARKLARHHLADVYPHLCPADEKGTLPPVDAGQVELFLDVVGKTRVMPWVGGNRYRTAKADLPAWRSCFADSCAALLTAHPRLAGVHVNIEPCASGSRDLLDLLEELRRKLPPKARLSVSGYPPPTAWQPSPLTHWDQAYIREVSKRVDQIAFMMYDTGITHPWPYQRLMSDWTRDVLEWSTPTEVLLGLPAYDDAWASYHRPEVEDLGNSLVGVHAGLLTFMALPANYQGTAIYCDWEMTEVKWSTYRELFVRP